MKKFYKDQDLKIMYSVFNNLNTELIQNNNKSKYIDNFTIHFYDVYSKKNYSIHSYNLSNPDKETYYNLNINDNRKPTESFKKYHKRTNKKLSFKDVLSYIKHSKNIESITIIKKDIRDLNLNQDSKICLFFDNIRINIEGSINLIYDLKKNEIITQDKNKILNLFKELKDNNYISIFFNDKLNYLCDYFLLY